MTRIGIGVVGVAILGVLGLALAPRFMRSARPSPVRTAYLIGSVALWWAIVPLGNPWPVVPLEVLLLVLAWRNHLRLRASG
ncbi:MAG: hypothetical protein ACRD0U_05355 [Acidimicrobiales bacterium]